MKTGNDRKNEEAKCLQMRRKQSEKDAQRQGSLGKEKK
jgi:hypothetical protein